jgi:hypothetical protein
VHKLPFVHAVAAVNVAVGQKEPTGHIVFTVGDGQKYLKITNERINVEFEWKD